MLNLSIAVGIDWCITYADSALGRILNMQPLVAIGVLSYSLYLWQQPFLNPHSNSPIADFPANVILAFCVAVASYLFIERPFLMLRSHFSPSASPNKESAGVPEALSMANSAAR